jgi:hypothetical protein
MFSIRKKSNPIFLDCYTHDSICYEYAQVDHAWKHMPDWWEKQNTKTSADGKTIKGCPGIINLYKKGIVFPLPTQLEIFFDKDKKQYGWKTSNKNINIVSHNDELYSEFAKQGVNFKIVLPWYISCEEDISFDIHKLSWNMRDKIQDFDILPGVTEFVHNKSMIISCFVDYNKTQKIDLDPLDVLTIMLPLTEREVKIRTHKISSEDYFDKMSYTNITMNKSRYKFIKKALEKRKIKKCPF